MKTYFGKPSVGFVIVLIVFGCLECTGQKNDKRWLRVISGADFTTDVDRHSLILVPGGIIGATFRTNEEKSEPVPGNGNQKYRVRVDEMHFRTDESQYKLIGSKFFGSSEKLVHSFTPAEENPWKEIRSDTGRRLFRAASQLSPFGTWKFRSYQYASGERPGPNEPSELKDLIDSEISLYLHYVKIGKAECGNPLFEPQVVSNEEFTRMIGSSMELVGVKGDKVDAIVLRCPSSQVFLPQTLIFRLTDGSALLLWEGVFFKVERPPNLFRPEIYF